MSLFARSITRGAARSMTPAVRAFRRGYAEAVSADKIRLSLALPREILYEHTEVTQVNLPTTAGDIGILANHVPIIQELRPGVVEVVEGSGSTKQFFVAGGFATVSEGSTLAINAVEAYPVEDFSSEAVKSLIAEAQKNSTSSDEDVATTAKIELEVLEALSVVAKN